MRQRVISEREADLDTRVEATRKAFRAVTGKVGIFISYKRAEHAEAAQALELALRSFGGQKVNVFLNTSSLAYGKNWYQSIGQSLKNAHCFILLVPDDADEREWPIFEAGCFAGGYFQVSA